MLLDATQASDHGVAFARDLARHGDHPALVTEQARLTYRELAVRVDRLAQRLGPVRRLVLVAVSNDLDSLVGYLAALSGGHPVLLAAAGRPKAIASLVSTYDPDVIVRGSDAEERRPGTAHHLHPDLALLLSTSGSTGAAKLVRLSRQNLESNAASIAQYLDIRQSDRGATSLPLHYCYGLSVVNSHLSRGASLLLTDRSVVDDRFWEQFRAEQATSFAGVPHTFELLDRIGFADMALPHLRFVTQAGGRLPPETVRRFAELGMRRGWDLFVMYGQTEATARMAYLPPQLAARHPECVGVAVPGGSFSLGPAEHPDSEVGELIYAGPNVMLGYAETPEDLGLGRSVESLATGDLARQTSDGLVQLVGRRSRFVKVSGTRIDLDGAENALRDIGIPACCLGQDDRLVVAVEGGHDPAMVRRLAATELGVASCGVLVCPLAAIPRLDSGKPDYRCLAELVGEQAQRQVRVAPAPVPSPSTSGAQDDEADLQTLRALFAELLGIEEVGDDDTFVGLGGDSLSYVEMSIRLETLLGELPEGWHVTAIRDLAPAAHRPASSARPRRRRRRVVETSVAIRAMAILLIVGTHSHLWHLQGTAHVLVAVAGFNFARFQLADEQRGARLRRQLGSVARIAVPSMLWIGGAYLLSDRYGLANVFLVNALFGSERWSTQWDFWFIEVLVLTLLTLSLLLAVPFAHRSERRFPLGFASVALIVGLVWRFNPALFDLLHTKPVFWLFALGWATAGARRRWHRLALSAVTLAAVPGFFGDARRDGVILAGVLLLLWTTSLSCPGWLTRVAGVLASASLYIYLTHWQVFPHLQGWSPLLATLASLLVGVGYWQLTIRLPGWLRAGRAGLRERKRASPNPATWN